MFKVKEVEVVCSDNGYKLVVAVYRSSLTPEKITVHIERVIPIPPRVPQEPLGEPEVAQVVSSGDGRIYKAHLYPLKR